MNTIGFFGFEIDGDVKLADIESPYEAFAPHYLDWVRDANREDLLRMVAALQMVPINADEDEIAQAFGYGDASDFAEKVGAFPDGILDGALGSPKEMLYNGVVYGTDHPSDVQTAEYGYVINLTQGTLDCYIGNQLSPHDEGLFFLVDPIEEGGSVAAHYGLDSVKVFPPRMYASYDWDKLPTKADFIKTHDRAIKMQEDMNKLALDAVKQEKKKTKSSLFHSLRNGRSVYDDAVCGARIKSNGQSCVLRQGHGGHHRSRI